MAITMNGTSFLFAVCMLLAICRGDTAIIRNTDFMSRPNIIGPELRINYINSDTIAPGYIFLAPNNPDGSQYTSTMYIYNSAGHLVWSGQHFNDAGHTHNNFHVCQYLKQPHLCVTMFDGPRGGGAAKDSYSLILDQTYSPVRVVAPNAKYHGSRITQDLHEFRVISNGLSAIGTCHAVVQRRVSIPECPDAVANAVEYVRTGIFTETLLDGTNETTFLWDALDHVDVADTYLCPRQGDTGSGATRDRAFDFFHINSVDKDANGDYLVSARHTSTIYKVAGNQPPKGFEPGDIIWRLGGKSETFTRSGSAIPENQSLNFSAQHDARFREGGISLWDNANNGITPATALSSSGLDIDIDEENKAATLVYQALPPRYKLDVSQGNHQILPNGNHFCGMGSVNEIYERTADGELVLDANYAYAPTQSYRAFKFPWSGRPKATSLAIFTYAYNCSGPQTTYVSWNGVTAAVSYRVHASNSFEGPYYTVGEEHKGVEFETAITYSSYHNFTYVTAFDSDGIAIGATDAVRTFVPEEGLREDCDLFRCAPRFPYDDDSRATC